MPLRKYQKDDVARICKQFEKTDYFILGSEGGTGKTLVGLKTFEKLHKEKNYSLLVIICPSFLRDNWINEINKFLPPAKKRKYVILIETYSSVLNQNIAIYLRKQKIDLLILDEGHYLKSFDSLRTKIIFGEPGQSRKIIAQAKKVLNLTATFTPNNVGEAYPFLWAVKSDLIRNLTQDDFIVKHAEKFNRTKFGLRHSGILDPDKFLKNQPWFLRRTIDEVAPEIPQGTRININIDIDSKTLKEENEIFAELLKESGLSEWQIIDLLDDPEYFLKMLSVLPGFVKYSEYKKRQGLIKVQPVAEYLKNIVLPEHKKFIVMCYHTSTAEKYFEILNGCIDKKKGEKIILVTGETDKIERYNLLTAANLDDKTIIVATIGSIKEGYNLQNYSYTFITELDWRAYVLRQCEYRTRRIGSTKPMFWYYCIFDKGMDQKIFSVLLTKRETQKKIYGKE